MAGKCTIVMYHYVRNMSETRFPEIKGLRLDDFKGQIAYLKRFHEFIDGAQFVDACDDRTTLPSRAVLLTFDDGYADHFENVLPVLVANDVSGCFFAPVRAVRDGVVLDVNKIHFVLASASAADVRRALEGELDRLRSDGHDIPSDRDLWDRFSSPGRYDPPEVAYVKKLLQRELPPVVRSDVVASLFARFVTENERAFARELYVTVDQLKMMMKCGMTIGSHGHDHMWMDRIDPAEQRREVERGLEFLDDIGVPCDRWMMAYPYGAYNDTLVDVCRELGCGAAFTTRVGIAEVNVETRLELLRLDTNDLPKAAQDSPVDWTLEASVVAGR